MCWWTVQSVAGVEAGCWLVVSCDAPDTPDTPLSPLSPLSLRQSHYLILHAGDSGAAPLVSSVQCQLSHLVLRLSSPPDMDILSAQ